MLAGSSPADSKNISGSKEAPLLYLKVQGAGENIKIENSLYGVVRWRTLRTLYLKSNFLILHLKDEHTGNFKKNFKTASPSLEDIGEEKLREEP